MTTGDGPQDLQAHAGPAGGPHGDHGGGPVALQPHGASGPQDLPGCDPHGASGPQDLPGCDPHGASGPQDLPGCDPHGAGGVRDSQPGPSDVAGGGPVALQPPGDARGGWPSDLAGGRQAGPAAPRTRPDGPVLVEWPAAAADFVLLLAVDDLPPAPFRLNPWTETRDAAKMLRWLQADIKRGPSGPRAFYGALQRDLQDLQRFALRAADERQAMNETRKAGDR